MFRGSAYADTRERSVAAGLPPGAHRADTGVVHATGRAVSARVPRAQGAPRAPRHLPDARARREGHAAPGRATRSGRGHPLLGHRGAASRHGRGGPNRRGARPRDRIAAAQPLRCATAETIGPRRGRPVRGAGGEGADPGARRPADRVLGGAVHPGQLLDRGRVVANVRQDQGPHDRGANDLARTDGATVRDGADVPARAGAGGRGGGPAVRQLGGRPQPAGLRPVRPSVRPSHLRRARGAGSAAHPLRRGDRRAAWSHA